ncbi:arginyltransferase [Thalassotalea euphylliae]|uniref:arginyltransferase n=1 Tax=Thalassotalea euphylliae TaxID=1655234 RepID=UPI00362F24A0
MKYDFRLGITKPFPCNYLPKKEERLLLVIDSIEKDSDQYDWLMYQGFRRSGSQVYRPHCEQCNRCQSIRVRVPDFTPSKSQKRLYKKNKNYSIRITDQSAEHYYELYERYINTLHQDGAMYPATREQYQGFVFSSVCHFVFLEIYDGEKLVSVAVTDVLPSALSAVYTFYDPDYRKQSMGMFSILCQLEYAKKINKPYLYLGYQIDECQKMNYKNKFLPHERLVGNRWQLINK